MKVLILVHKDLIPAEDMGQADFDREKVPWVTEYDVKRALKATKHEVEVPGVSRLQHFIEKPQLF